MSRFDYVKYDEAAVAAQAIIKSRCEDLEGLINALPKGRYSSLALTSLEEVYMWIGKVLRDAQIERNGSAPLQEERTNS